MAEREGLFARLRGLTLRAGLSAVPIRLRRIGRTRHIDDRGFERHPDPQLTPHQPDFVC